MISNAAQKKNKAINEDAIMGLFSRPHLTTDQYYAELMTSREDARFYYPADIYPTLPPEIEAAVQRIENGGAE